MDYKAIYAILVVEMSGEKWFHGDLDHGNVYTSRKEAEKDLREFLKFRRKSPATFPRKVHIEKYMPQEKQ